MITLDDLLEMKRKLSVPKLPAPHPFRCRCCNLVGFKLIPIYSGVLGPPIAYLCGVCFEKLKKETDDRRTDIDAFVPEAR